VPSERCSIVEQSTDVVDGRVVSSGVMRTHHAAVFWATSNE
jgi:hypothetical protein